MSGVKAIRYLLANNAPLIAVVPATKIMAGVLPQGIAAPAIAITGVSTIRRHPVGIATVEYCTSRVQVTVFATTYPLLKSTLALVRTALPRSRGTVNSVKVDSILHALDGPDFTDDTGLHIGSVDYVITFNE